MKVITDTEFDNRHRKQSDTEYDHLKSSIKDIGLRHPILVWDEEGIIIDGHHRYRACLELKIKPRYIFKSFPTRDRALLEADRSQASMRNLSPEEYAILLLRIRDYEQTLEKVAPYGATSKNQDRLKLQSLREISEESGASKRTITRLKKVVDSGNEEVIEKVISGDLTATEAEREVTGKSKPIMESSESDPVPEIFGKKIVKKNDDADTDTDIDHPDKDTVKAGEPGKVEKVEKVDTPNKHDKPDTKAVPPQSVPIPRAGYELKQCGHCNGSGYIEVKQAVEDECPLYGKHSLNKWGTCPCGYDNKEEEQKEK